MRDTAVFVESALMAVEKWLYERIDTKEDVSDAVNQVLTETKSAAFLGLLVSVGLYSPRSVQQPSSSSAIVPRSLHNSALDIARGQLEVLV